MPKFGVDFMVWEDFEYKDCDNPHWYNADYHISIPDYQEVTHWMPLPDAPLSPNKIDTPDAEKFGDFESEKAYYDYIRRTDKIL